MPGVTARGELWFASGVLGSQSKGSYCSTLLSRVWVLSEFAEDAEVGGAQGTRGLSEGSR